MKTPAERPGTGKERRHRRRLQPWVGPWLREQRENDKLLGVRASDIEDVAKRLRRDRSAVSRIETGTSAIPADDLPVFLRAYRRTVSQFAARASKEAA